MIKRLISKIKNAIKRVVNIHLNHKVVLSMRTYDCIQFATFITSSVMAAAFAIVTYAAFPLKHVLAFWGMLIGASLCGCIYYGAWFFSGIIYDFVKHSKRRNEA